MKVEVFQLNQRVRDLEAERDSALKVASEHYAATQEQAAELRKLRTVIEVCYAVLQHADKMPNDREPLEPWLSEQVALKEKADAAVREVAKGGR